MSASAQDLAHRCADSREGESSDPPTSERWSPFAIWRRGQLKALVDQMPEDPDAVVALMDDPGYELRIEDVAFCCRTRLVLLATWHTQGMAA